MASDGSGIGGLRAPRAVGALPPGDDYIGVTRPHASSEFGKNGFASLTDLTNVAWRDLYRHLESEQESFLQRDAQFRSPGYVWPRDALHTWSRVWEYPFVFYHLRKLLALHRPATEGAVCRVADIGSGVTFFPFAVAKLGCSVICTDIDPIVERDMGAAIKEIAADPGKVTVRRGGGTELPFDDGELDLAYCVSVIEHVANPRPLITEIARALKPGGTLVLTVDVDLRGDAAISVAQRHALLSELGHDFMESEETRSVHPRDLLTSELGPFPVLGPRGVAGAWFMGKQLAKALMFRRRAPRIPFRLAVEGLVLKRIQHHGVGPQW